LCAISLVPWVVWGFFKLITPFIDPLTREKLKFNEDMKQYVPAEQLWTDFSDGHLKFEYDHSVYWPALMELTRERREQRKARWVAGGKLVGESEDYLAGAVEHGVAGPQGQAEKPVAAAASETEAAKVADADVPAAEPEAPTAPSDVKAATLETKLEELKVDA